MIEGAVGALTGYQQVALAVRRVHRGRRHGRLGRCDHGARGTLSPSPEHRDVSVPVVLGSRARPAGAGRTPRDRIALRTDTLYRRTGDCARDGLPLLEGVRGATADAARGVWRRPGLGGIRGGMGDGVARGRSAARRDAHDGRRLDAVAGAAAPDGQRPGALVAQPHSPYMNAL